MGEDESQSEGGREAGQEEGGQEGCQEGGQEGCQEGCQEGQEGQEGCQEGSQESHSPWSATPHFSRGCCSEQKGGGCHRRCQSHLWGTSPHPRSCKGSATHLWWPQPGTHEGSKEGEEEGTQEETCEKAQTAEQGETARKA